jgi:hypothetical protein
VLTVGCKPRVVWTFLRTYNFQNYFSKLYFILVFILLVFFKTVILFSPVSKFEMAHTHRTARKRTGHQPTGQLVSRNVPPQPEPQHDSPQHVLQGEDSFEIVVIVPAGEDMQEAQHMPQNDDHGHQEEENNEEEKEEDKKAKGEEDEYYTPWSNAEKDETFHNTDEIKTFGDEAPIPTGRLRGLLNYINITTPPEFKIKRIPRPGREEYKAIMEIISGPNVLSRHKGLTFRTTY